MNVLYYAMRYRASGGDLERDFAHEADMRRQAREQLRLDCMDEEEPNTFNRVHQAACAAQTRTRKP